jgi:sirohydrochlorin cobaltochelatase
MQADSKRGTILLAHGSRDPLWRKPIEAVAAHVRVLVPGVPVRCAYMELTEPDLSTCAAELISLGVSSITVLPLFFGMGKHTREDLPLLMVKLQASHPQIAIDLRPAVGEDARVIELVARIALS